MDYYNTFTKPNLIEPGVKHFFTETLRKCSHFKQQYYNYIINIAIGVFFIVILGTILLYKYKGKLTPIEKDIQNRERQQYIMTKIKNYQENKLRAQQELITGLPQWNNEYDVIQRKINIS